jgi:hypothetical protein
MVAVLVAFTSVRGCPGSASRVDLPQVRTLAPHPVPCGEQLESVLGAPLTSSNLVSSAPAHQGGRDPQPHQRPGASPFEGCSWHEQAVGDSGPDGVRTVRRPRRWGWGTAAPDPAHTPRHHQADTTGVRRNSDAQSADSAPRSIVWPTPRARSARTGPPRPGPEFPRTPQTSL